MSRTVGRRPPGEQARFRASRCSLVGTVHAALRVRLNDMRKTLLALTMGSALMFGVTADAHHSFPATYQVSKTITLQGKVAQLLFRNPHSFLHVDVADVSGQVQRWSLEWGGASQLTSQGVVKDTLKVGDVLMVTANPARSTENATRALVKTIVRPVDGWSWGQAPNQVVD